MDKNQCCTSPAEDRIGVDCPRDQDKTLIRACPICGDQPARGLVRDHCHASGYNRDLICSRCNVGLGMFRDRADHLRAAADYLDHHAHAPRPTQGTFANRRLEAARAWIGLPSDSDLPDPPERDGWFLCDTASSAPPPGVVDLASQAHLFRLVRRTGETKDQVRERTRLPGFRRK